MALDEEPLRPRAGVLEIGGDISALSETEIEERMERLDAEIARLRAVLAAKKASRAAADAFFKR
ncbi:MAG TPA: DUF1192 family protein [Xanthobacteraceae bacterium]|nr:DUF1192 family protein [Xanthobacteraceae bacterium]